MEDTTSMPISRDNRLEFVKVPLKEDLAFRAVAANEIETLSRLLEGGYQINTLHEENPDGPYFTIHDFSRMIRQICLKGYSILHVAVVHASMDIIHYLISKGADVNLSDTNNMSPLSLSVVIQRPDVAQILIDSGANVNMQSLSGRTPLIEACANGCVPIVKMLIKAGCDLELADCKGTTPIFACLNPPDRRVKKESLGYLIQGGAKVDHPNKQGATALMLAVGLGLKDAATTLLEAGADINLSDKKGKTVAHLASGSNMALYLLNWGATSDKPDDKGVRPLDRAVKMGHIGLIRVFLGADSHREYDLLNKTIVQQVRQQVPAFDRWLHDEMENPRQLKRLCRQVIRESLSPTKTTKIKDLPIPLLLKDFLLVKHLDIGHFAPEAIQGRPIG